MEPVFSDWLTGTLSDEGWGPRDDKIVQFASHYFLYFPIFHLKYSYIFPIFCPSEFLYSYFFVKKVTGRPALYLLTYLMGLDTTTHFASWTSTPSSCETRSINVWFSTFWPWRVSLNLANVCSCNSRSSSRHQTWAHFHQQIHCGP